MIRLAGSCGKHEICEFYVHLAPLLSGEGRTGGGGEVYFRVRQNIERPEDSGLSMLNLILFIYKD